jgi:hypothetical protein
MKLCCTCKIQKPFNEFHKKKSTRDGYHLRCKACRKIESINYRNDNKETRVEYDKNYYTTNKEKILQYQHRYRENNKSKILEYRKRNKITIDEQRKIYRKLNKERIAAYQKQERLQLFLMINTWRYLS